MMRKVTPMKKNQKADDDNNDKETQNSYFVSEADNRTVICLA